MLGLLLVFILVGIGFAAGYATRAFISRKRRAAFLAYEPYIAPSRRPPAQTAYLDAAKRAAVMNPKSARKAEDISQTFKEVHIKSNKAARGNLRIVSEQNARPAAEPPTGTKLPTITKPRAVDHSLLEELIRRLGQDR